MLTAITLFFWGIAGLILFSLMAAFHRGLQSATAWQRVTGRIQAFGLTNGVPRVSYVYQVSGSTYNGRAIVPGALFTPKAGPVDAPKSAWLHADGSLKFPPDADAEVFYNPRNPADAVLVPGMASGWWKTALIGVVFAAIPVVFRYQKEWAASHAKELFGGLFFCAGLFLLGYAAVLLRRALQTRRYPFVTGRLLKAEIVYSNSGEGSGGYTPSVEFAYEVDGKHYQSAQLTAIPVTTLTSRQAAQAKVDRLLQSPEPRVYFNPHAPWEGFLQPGPFWGPLLPFVMALAFMGMGLAVLFLKQGGSSF